LLRFGNQRPRRPTYSPRTRGVWMLLVMLGAVILLMRQVRQPSSVAFLGQLFANPRSQQGGDAAVGKGVAIKPVVADAESAAAVAKSELPPLDEKLWGPVKDNATFLSAEQPAWFALLQQANDLSLAEIAEKSIGNAAYAQLINQPDAYRGKSVQVEGRILRESTKPVAKNDFGITELHQLILAPRGGGQWPIVVYAIELPPGFPRGDDLSEDIVVDGLFFKNWSFPYDGGMGLAPVLVTPTLAWTSANGGDANGVAPLKVADAAPATSKLMVGAFLAGGAAVVFVLWAAMQTRRPRRAIQTPPELSGLESEP
jgi:hypothetical protein